MGEQRGAGVKMGTRCIWDAEADSYAYDNFVNVRIKFSHHSRSFFLKKVFLNKIPVIIFNIVLGYVILRGHGVCRSLLLRSNQEVPY